MYHWIGNRDSSLMLTPMVNGLSWFTSWLLHFGDRIAFWHCPNDAVKVVCWRTRVESFLIWHAWPTVVATSDSRYAVVWSYYFGAVLALSRMLNYMWIMPTWADFCTLHIHVEFYSQSRVDNLCHWTNGVVFSCFLWRASGIPYMFQTMIHIAFILVWCSGCGWCAGCDLL